MQILLTFFVLFFSSTTFAERLNCSYIHNDEPRAFILERDSEGEYFNWTTHANRKFTLDILHETEKELILGEMFNYGEAYGDAFYTLYFDKKSNKYRSGNLPPPSNDNISRENQWRIGFCLVN